MAYSTIQKLTPYIWDVRVVWRYHFLKHRQRQVFGAAVQTNTHKEMRTLAHIRTYLVKCKIFYVYFVTIPFNLYAFTCFYINDRSS